MRTLNFSAGPGTLPIQVLEQAQRDLVDYQGRGLSVMEMSHRSPDYDDIHLGAIGAMGTLLGVPDTHDVLFLQGGASLQFAMVPMNLMGPDGSADYVVTGTWAKKAYQEAQKFGRARLVASTEEIGHARVPHGSEMDVDPGAAYFHYTSNNTITGTQFHTMPDVGEVPLVCDMSSDILSRPVNVAAHGLIYAGAQKNMGPAGTTAVIVQKDLLDRAPDSLPTTLGYKIHSDKESRYNTPPCWAIYIVGLVCRWVASQGGLTAMARINEEKAAILYERIDRNDFYRGPVEVESRSRMNVPFRLPSEDLEARFLVAAGEAQMSNLKGHRSVGGIRASIYNAMPKSGVEALVGFMDEFERQNG